MGLLSLAGAIGACAGGSEVEAQADALRADFPEHSARILDDRTVTVSTEEDGYSIVIAEERGAAALFPHRASQAIRIDLPSGGRVYVRETGAHGDVKPAGSALTYARRGGASFWTRTAAGIEEWLLLEAGHAFAGETVAAWEVEGADLYQRGAVVELRDPDSGAVRMAVTAPVAYAAGGREVPVRISARGNRISVDVDAGGAAVLVDPQWVLTEAMGSARSQHTATQLPTGDVLIIGGVGANGKALATIELYSPTTEGWMTHTAMSVARRDHAATLLADGKVLVTGGTNGVIGLSSAEVYDPSTRKWKLLSPMHTVRVAHTATLLQDGRVLVAGGLGAEAWEQSSTEIYDPGSNTWTFAGPMSVGRSYHTATRLPDGRVLLWGSDGTAVFPTSNIPFDLYNPTTNACTALLISEPTRQRHTATLLPDGKVLIAGGEIAGTVLDSAQIFDPMSNMRTFVQQLGSARAGHTATLLPYGKVLLAGGYYAVQNNTTYLGVTELYDAPTDTWSFGPALNIARRSHTATLMPDTRVLVAGGAQTFAIDSAELYGTALGDPCGAIEDCPSGYCVDGVCCDTACDTGVCDACSQALGASVSGTCELLTGTPCDDGDACTQADACQAGACASGASVTCSPSSECHAAGTCDPATGTCSEVLKDDGASCEGGTCKAGECIPTPDAGSGGGGGSGNGGAGNGGDEPSFSDNWVVQGGGGCWCSAAGGQDNKALWPLATLLLVGGIGARRRSRQSRRGLGLRIGDRQSAITNRSIASSPCAASPWPDPYRRSSS
jgi:MYXO-CTERM domain-containing protein